jgi:hypothetical protein
MTSRNPTCPRVMVENLEDGYRSMAGDEEREREAVEWSEALIEDMAHD